jgi:hypothetical protein
MDMVPQIKHLFLKSRPLFLEALNYYREPVFGVKTLF